MPSDNITQAKTFRLFCPKLHRKILKHNISYNIKSKRANLVKHTFHRLVKVTLLLRLLSANCQPVCPPPIHLSSLPWLVVASSFVVQHPPPPVVFTTCRLILSSSCRATSTSHRFEVPPALQMPPPLVRWCLQLIVTTSLVTPLPLLVLSTIHHHLSANASPPVGLLFASWLSCHPCLC